MAVRFEWEADAIEQMLAVPGVAAKVAAGTERVLAAVKAAAPVDDGDYVAGLTSDIRAGSGGRPVGAVKANAPHSFLVEYGTAVRTSRRGYRGVMPALAPLRRGLDASGLRVG